MYTMLYDIDISYFLKNAIHTKKFIPSPLSQLNFSILQQWAGDDACEDVIWEKCEFKPKRVNFTFTAPECSITEQIPWTDCKPGSQMTDVAKMICEVKQDISCKPVTRKKSKIITYEVCEEKEAPMNCKPMTIRKPKQVINQKIYDLHNILEKKFNEIIFNIQELDHKKKCLFPAGYDPQL